MKHTIVYFLTAVFCLNISCLAEESITDVLFGTWKFHKVIPGNITAITTQEAEALLGKDLVISPEYVNIFCKKGADPVFSHYKKNAADYLYSNYKINKDILSIKNDSVEVIEIKCMIDNSESYFNIILADHKKLILIYKGFFFLSEVKITSTGEINYLNQFRKSK